MIKNTEQNGGILLKNNDFLREGYEKKYFKMLYSIYFKHITVK